MSIESRRACHDTRVSQNRGVTVGRKIWARLKQKDATLRIRAQSRGQDCASRAAAHDDEVEGLFGSIGGTYIAAQCSFHNEKMFTRRCALANTLLPGLRGLGAF
jgi:hypothetical protein